MAAGLGRALMLAVVGVAAGFALVVAVMGPAELKKRATAMLESQPTVQQGAPGAPRPLAGEAETPKPAGNAEEKRAAIGGSEVPADLNFDTHKPGEPRKPETDGPSLDIVRVEPSGDAVIAGRVAPNATVEILRDNKPIASAKADPSGQFAIVPPTLPTGNSELSYRSVAPDGTAVQGKESVAIVVAENRTTKPLVAVSTPDKPTAVLSQPDAPSGSTPEQKIAEAKKTLSGKAEDKSQAVAALPEAKPDAKAPTAAGTPVRIVSIDAQDGGRLDVTGVAPAGAAVRLYLNDTLVASGQAAADGKIAFTIGRGVQPGGYQVRIDQIEPGSGKVAHRAQVAFAFPASAGPKVASRETAPIPARPEAERKPAGDRAPRSPTAEIVAPTPPPQAPAAEALAAARKPEPAKPAAQASASPPQPDRTETAPKREPETQAKSEPAPTPSEKAAQPKQDSPAVAVVSPKPEASPEGRVAASEAPKSTVSEGMKSDAPTPGTSAASTPDKPGAVFVPEISTAKITRGDNLWQISRKTYGNGLRYTVIFDANKEQIKDPDLIYPGQIFVLPTDQGGAKRG